MLNVAHGQSIAAGFSITRKVETIVARKNRAYEWPPACLGKSGLASGRSRGIGRPFGRGF